eukprot:m.56716 g.56716  ORF g.56716 m.56716 type:complete len:74 (-) comp15591_c0_seq12:2092-2313(-)
MHEGNIHAAPKNDTQCSHTKYLESHGTFKHHKSVIRLGRPQEHRHAIPMGYCEKPHLLVSCELVADAMVDIPN